MLLSNDMSDDKKLEISTQVKLQDTPHFTYLNKETGLLETRHMITGEILSMQSSMDENILLAKERRAHLVVVDGKELWVEAGIALNEIPKSSIYRSGGRKTQWVYSTLVGEIICQQIVEGLSMNQISKTKGFPPIATITRWRKNNSSFNKMVEDAYKHRGEFHRDRVLELIEEDPIFYDENKQPLVTKDGAVVMKDTGARKLQIDGHKWLAEKDNAERYGSKTKIEGEVQVKHTIFKIDTGIREPGDIGYNLDQTRIAQEQEAKRLGDINGSAAAVYKEVQGGEGESFKKDSRQSTSDVRDGSLPFKPKV